MPRDGSVTMAVNVWRARATAFLSSSEWPRLRREGLWVVAGQIFVALAGLATVRLMTELAEPRLYGEFNLLLNAATFARFVFTSPIYNAQARHYPEYQQAGLGNWYSAEIERMAWIATALCMGCCGAAFMIFHASGSTALRASMLLPMLALIAVETPKNARLVRLNAERRQARYAVWQIGDAWLIFAGAAVMFLIYGNSEGWMAGQAIATFAALIVFGILLAPNYAPDTGAQNLGGRTAVVRKTLQFGLPFVPITILGWTLLLSDRFVLAKLMGTTEVGLYAAAAALAARPVTLAGSFLATLMRPVLFSAASAGQEKKARNVFAAWLAIATAGAAVIFVLLAAGGDFVAAFLLGAKYRIGAAGVMAWVGLGCGLLAVTQVLEVRLMAHGNTRSLIAPQFVAAATALGLTFLLAPKFGALGAAQARAAAGVVQLVITLFMLWMIKPGAQTPAESAMQIDPLQNRESE